MSKADLEAYRVQRFASPHPASNQQLKPSNATADDIQPDEGRVIVHFDVDAFYAQCEEVRDPSLRTRPLGITQKYLIVTANYPARARGVTKLMGIKDALAKVPDLVLVSGEDLTPYRQASRSILGVLSRFGVVEKGGMDEAFVDISKEARARVAAGAGSGKWHGHLHMGDVALQADNPHRPMDLRAPAVSNGTVPAAAEDPLAAQCSWYALLQAGSAIAAEARAAVKAETGFRTSAGIAANKLLAKLVSGLHKPDDQTILPPPAAALFIAPLPLRAISGIGYKLDADLRELGFSTAQSLRGEAAADLVGRFGERIGSFLHKAVRGQDPSPVKLFGAPKTVTVEDSFKSCSSAKAARHVIHILAPDLLARLAEDHEEHGRRPQSFVLKWRISGSNYRTGNSRSSASCNMPPVVRHPFGGEAQTAAIVDAAMTLLTRNAPSPFNLSLLNLGATNFTEGRGKRMTSFFQLPAPPSAVPPAVQAPSATASGSAERDRWAAHAATHARRDYGAAPAGAALSKSAERALREGSSAAGMLPAVGSSPLKAARHVTQPPQAVGSPAQAAQSWQQAPSRAASTAVPTPRLSDDGSSRPSTGNQPWQQQHDHGFDCGNVCSSDDGGSGDEWQDILHARREATAIAAAPSAAAQLSHSHRQPVDSRHVSRQPAISSAAQQGAAVADRPAALTAANRSVASQQPGVTSPNGSSAAPDSCHRRQSSIPQAAVGTSGNVASMVQEAAGGATCSVVPALSEHQTHCSLAGGASAQQEGAVKSASCTAIGSTPAAALPVAPAEQQVLAPDSEQELADRRLAERLQQEEEAAEAERRRRSRERFLAAGAAASLQRRGGGQKRHKSSSGPLDMFVKRQAS